MKAVYQKYLVQSPLTLLRKAGYAPFTDPKTGKDSYVLRLTSDYYPRFHLYLSETNETITFNLHLDQKKPSYQNTAHKHSGDYDSPVIVKELDRLSRWIALDSGALPQEAPMPTKPKKSNKQPNKTSLFGGIFQK
jgi:hypothetical protein